MEHGTEPKWLKHARAQIGTHEVPGPASNPSVERYYLEAVGKRLTDDVPWCAAFVGAMLRRSGVKPSGSLLARSYLRWGKRIEPRPGCIVVLERGEPGSGTGHVGFYVSDNGDGSINLLGGNQNDAVTIARMEKRRVLDYRWPSTDA